MYMLYKLFIVIVYSFIYFAVVFTILKLNKNKKMALNSAEVWALKMTYLCYVKDVWSFGTIYQLVSLPNTVKGRLPGKRESLSTWFCLGSKLQPPRFQAHFQWINLFPNSALNFEKLSAFFCSLTSCNLIHSSSTTLSELYPKDHQLFHTLLLILKIENTKSKRLNNQIALKNFSTRI